MTRFSHIGGHAALDLVNTVEWRLSDEQREEDLESFDDVLEWCRESGLLSEEEASHARELAHGDGAARERDLVIELREAVYAAVFCADEQARRVLDHHIAEALTAARLEPGPDTWTWADLRFTAATPRHRIARLVVDLVQRSDLARLHQCEDRHCGWVFLDTSRAHNRRWCVTKDCGDRNRSRAYYARQKQKN